MDTFILVKGPFVLAAVVSVAASVVVATHATPAEAPPAEPVELAYVSDDVPEPRTPPPAPPPQPVVVDTSLRVGSRGQEVLALEDRLASLSYMVGKVDGVFDRATYHGVIAFQKVEGLPRNGKGDTLTLKRLAIASRPHPAFVTPLDHLEVDIPRQVVFVVRGGEVAAVLPTSTGSNRLFTAQGWTRRAVTPNGAFKVARKINGLRISPLGELYKPSYFNGGIAFHGNPSVPAYPASHGCVRLPMQFADWFFANAPVGMAVYVYGGPDGPNPQPVIDDAPASPSPSPEPSEQPSPSPSPDPSPLPSPSPIEPSVTPTATA